MNGASMEALKKRSVMIAGHRTSVSLEPAFWDALRAIAATEERSLQAMIGTIDAQRGSQNLSSAIRVFVLTSLQQAQLKVDPSQAER